jgi:hypothetical protein
LANLCETRRIKKHLLKGHKGRFMAIHQAVVEQTLTNGTLTSIQIQLQPAARKPARWCRAARSQMGRLPLAGVVHWK